MYSQTAPAILPGSTIGPNDTAPARVTDTLVTIPKAKAIQIAKCLATLDILRIQYQTLVLDTEALRRDLAILGQIDSVKTLQVKSLKSIVSMQDTLYNNAATQYQAQIAHQNTQMKWLKVERLGLFTGLVAAITWGIIKSLKL